MTAVLRHEDAAPTPAMSVRPVAIWWRLGLVGVVDDLLVHAPTPRLALRANVPGGVASTVLQR